MLISDPPQHAVPCPQRESSRPWSCGGSGRRLPVLGAGAVQGQLLRGDEGTQPTGLLLLEKGEGRYQGGISILD